MSPFFGGLVVVLIISTTAGILLVRDWRWIIIYLSIQYIGTFILTAQNWPLPMATVKIIAGWMSAAILGMTYSNLTHPLSIQENSPLPQGRFFRIMAGAVVIIIAITSAPFANDLLGDTGIAVASGSLILFGMGLLHLGITDQILRIVVGLITIMAGFETLYSAVESSVLVAALLAIINLGIALAGSYLMIASHQNQTENQ